MASKNQKLRKASWLGTKVDILRAIATFAGNMRTLAMNRVEQFEEQRDEILKDIEDDESEETNKED